MAAAMRIALWNANGLSSHRLELQTFLDMHKIDTALISEPTSRPERSSGFPVTLSSTPYNLTTPHTEARRF
jgi:hypothetical protein